MGSPLSPVIANLFMQEFEEKALHSATHKPTLWLRYVDDTFVIWSHGQEKLKAFLEHLNNVHPNIKFTIEIEQNDQLPFLDVLVKKKRDGRLGHTVYRKPTHTDRYINAKSHHDPSQLKSVIKTLINRSQKLADADNIKEEMTNIREALIKNGFHHRDIQRTLKPSNKEDKDPADPAIAKAYLPYIKGMTDKISRILQKHKIDTTFTPYRKIHSILRNPKDKIAL
ncbi:hypothetical protein RI129_000309 [Pyrocoelia pectoralis]|uniref:Reverse transcriptase domain-containing protein n=1 Tax=Pyrocoelia pectoralis TaxID=417401 RepID=A0AAN7ZJ82_9COLE